MIAHERLPAVPRILRHWLATTHAALRERDLRVQATGDVIVAMRAEHRRVQLVLRGDQPFDGRTVMQRWPDLDVWLLPASGDAAPSLARRGVLQASDAGTFAAAGAAAPSLWLCELADGDEPPPGRTITAPFVHAVLVMARS